MRWDAEYDVLGMKCSSCEKIIEKKILNEVGIKSVKADYVLGKLRLNGGITKAKLAKILADIGYEIKKSEGDKNRLTIKKTQLTQMALAFGILLLGVGAYTFMSEYFNLSIPKISEDTSFALIFVIGLFTGFHCIAMCGGFVLGIGQKAKGNGFGAQLRYGFAKTVSYTVIGAVFGFIGSYLIFTPQMRATAAILAGIFLIGFGLNMLDKMKWFRNVRLPSFGIFDRLSGENDKGPVALGLANGLMIACGPLQAFYILAASTGSPLTGASYLFAFGLGTLPALLGFGYFTTLISGASTRKIMHLSGYVVILLGVIWINRGLALSGSGYDVNTITSSVGPQDVSAQTAKTEISTERGDEFQTIYMNVTRYGWSPDVFVLKKNIPVKWIINGLEITGCNNAIQVPEYNLEFPIKKGEQIIGFNPGDKVGKIPFSCWMGMIPGTFIVTDDEDEDSKVIISTIEEAKTKQANAPSCGGGCGCGR